MKDVCPAFMWVLNCGRIKQVLNPLNHLPAWFITFYHVYLGFSFCAWSTLSIKPLSDSYLGTAGVGLSHSQQRSGENGQAGLSYLFCPSLLLFPPGNHFDNHKRSVLPDRMSGPCEPSDVRDRLKGRVADCVFEGI